MILVSKTVLLRWFVPLGVALSIAACGSQPDEHVLQGSSMGTGWSVKLFEPMDESRFSLITSQAQQYLDKVETMMSTYIDDSEVNRFNASRSTDWQEVSAEMVDVIAYAQQVSKLSQGAFDITVAPLVELWGFGSEQRERLPNEEEVKSVLQRLGYQHLSTRRQPPALRKSFPELQVDLSAIAKGYAVDGVVDILRSHGVTNYLAEVGGELRASGTSQQLQPWTVGVEKPIPGWREVMRAVQLDGIGIATSGDYRNFLEIDGRKYSHEINPRDGQPLPYRGASVTVIAPTAMEADAWATGLFVMGKEKGMQLARDQKLAVYFIEQSDDGFVQTMNKAFSKHLVTP